jgi:protein-S-isoprenylcysteine O-methyltransferase Ste14
MVRRLSISSFILVAAQFALMAALMWPGSGFRLGAWASLLLLASALLGLWTLSANRLGNFNIRPEVKAGARLVTSGPYRVIRHPMYAALLLFFAAAALAYGTSAKAILFAALILVLWAKSRAEERELSATFPEYSAYRARAKRFVPYLW